MTRGRRERQGGHKLDRSFTPVLSLNSSSNCDINKEQNLASAATDSPLILSVDEHHTFQ